MNRAELERYIAEVYSTLGENPWAQSPTNTVFRHRHNRKWFAIIMDIPREKLGLPGDGILSAVNVKCDPRLIGSFREEPGFFPAYHMNKAHWLTVALDGSAEEEKMKFLLDMSYELTKKRKRIALVYSKLAPIHGFFCTFHAQYGTINAWMLKLFRPIFS